MERGTYLKNSAVAVSNGKSMFKKTYLTVGFYILTAVIFIGISTHTAYAAEGGGFGGFPNPIAAESLDELINHLVVWLYIFSVPILSLILLYGAYLIVTSAGDEEKYREGTKIVKWGLIGFVLVLLSGAIATIIRSVVS